MEENKKQKWVIVGDNNYWYSILENATKEEAIQEADNILCNPSNYGSDDIADPTLIYLYPVGGDEIRVKAYWDDETVIS